MPHFEAKGCRLSESLAAIRKVGESQALLTAVKDNDLMVIMGTIPLTVILISLASFLLDICQALIDPRVLR